MIVYCLLLCSDPVFGCELAQLCERQGAQVPKFFSQFTQHIEKEGLDVVGIYRLSGNAASINKLRYLVEQGKLHPSLIQYNNPLTANLILESPCVSIITPMCFNFGFS